MIKFKVWSAVILSLLILCGMIFFAGYTEYSSYKECSKFFSKGYCFTHTDDWAKQRVFK